MEGKVKETIGSTRGLTRRDYFTGCALQSLLRSRAVEKSYAKVVEDAIQIGTLLDDQIDGETKEKKA